MSKSKGEVSRTIEEILSRFEKNKVRLKDAEYRLVLEPENTDLREDFESLKRSVRLIEEILMGMPSEERDALFWRYQYGKGDWEWKAVYFMYMSEASVYRRLAVARDRFMMEYEKRQG